MWEDKISSEKEKELESYEISEVQEYVNTIDPGSILDSPIWKRISEALRDTQRDKSDVNKRIFTGIFKSLADEKTLRDLLDETMSSVDNTKSKSDVVEVQ